MQLIMRKMEDCKNFKSVYGDNFTNHMFTDQINVPTKWRGPVLVHTRPESPRRHWTAMKTSSVLLTPMK